MTVHISCSFFFMRGVLGITKALLSNDTWAKITAPPMACHSESLAKNNACLAAGVINIYIQSRSHRMTHRREETYICIKISIVAAPAVILVCFFSLSNALVCFIAPHIIWRTVPLLHAWQKGYDTQIHDCDCWLLNIYYNQCYAAACSAIFEALF